MGATLLRRIHYELHDSHRSETRRQYARTYTNVNNSLSRQGVNNTRACGCRDKAKQFINTVCRGFFGLFSLCSSPVFRQIIAAVRAQIHEHANLDLHSYRPPANLPQQSELRLILSPHPSVLAAIQSATQKCR